MIDKNIYYTTRIVGTETIDELDAELEDSFGFNYDEHNALIEIVEGEGDPRYSYTCESHPILISTLQSIIDKAKSDGANYIEISNNVDHIGYDMSFLEILPATESDILKYKTVKNESKDKRKLREIEELKERLRFLENQ
jgi:hypothetical protein